MEIYWTSGAELNLLDVVDCIAADKPAAALDVGKKIRAGVEQLALLPSLGEAGRVASTRELTVPGTSYLVVYRVKNQAVQLLRLLHTAQRPPR